jgi:endoribonuclease LACTB2
VAGDLLLSSVVCVLRLHRGERELLWSKRRPELAFLGGFHAFFGGGLKAGDARVPTNMPDGLESKHVGCAARELFEESGILCLESETVHAKLDGTCVWSDLRRRLLNEPNVLFEEQILSLGRCVDATRYIPIGGWITPDCLTIRYDSRFYFVEITKTDALHAETNSWKDQLQPSELTDGEWITPSAALAASNNGEAVISAPVRLVLQDLLHTEFRAIEISSERAGLTAQTRCSKGLFILPLRTLTLPPATHTNSFIVGETDFILVDPGPSDAGQQAILEQWIDAAKEARGGQFLAVALTHHHIDHVGALSRIVERYQVPVWGHERTLAHLDNLSLPVTRALQDNDILHELGDDQVRVLFTPGHASGHLAFHHERTHTILAGDLVALRQTILVHPPDGHMGSYLESLKRVRDIRPRLIYPSHGEAISYPTALINQFLSHRQMREDKVEEALREHGSASVDEVLPRVYDDVPEHVLPIARLNLMAHLDHLVERGVARRDRDLFALVPQ